MFPLWRKCPGHVRGADDGFPLKCCDPVCGTVYVYAQNFSRNAHCPPQHRPSVERVKASLPECRHFSPFAGALTKGNQQSVLLGKTQGRGGGRPERDVADGHVLAKDAAVWCSVRPPAADRPLPVGDLGHQGASFILSEGCHGCVPRFRATQPDAPIPFGAADGFSGAGSSSFGCVRKKKCR